MNSDAARLHISKAPDEYNAEFLDRLSTELDNVLKRMLSPGVVRASKLNISQIPTSATGLRSGDVWSDSGVLTIVS